MILVMVQDTYFIAFLYTNNARPETTPLRKQLHLPLDQKEQNRNKITLGGKRSVHIKL